MRRASRARACVRIREPRAVCVDGQSPPLQPGQRTANLLSVDKAIHGLCPLDRPRPTPRVSWVDGLRILLGQTSLYGAHLILARSSPKAPGGSPGVTRSTPRTCGSPFRVFPKPAGQPVIAAQPVTPRLPPGASGILVTLDFRSTIGAKADGARGSSVSRITQPGSEVSERRGQRTAIRHGRARHSRNERIAAR